MYVTVEFVVDIDLLSYRNIADAVRERLVLEGPTPAGILADLGALNIERGRDHGLPGYIKFSTLCGGPNAAGDNFNQLTNIPFDQRVRLKTVYKVVEDIDLFAGILSENLQQGSQLGRTATCIILRQLGELRRADRFWYERNDLCTAFTLEQLTEIRKVTLAKLICDNTDDVERIQLKAFRRRTSNSGDNPLMDCGSLPFLNLNVFREGRHFSFFVIYNP